MFSSRKRVTDVSQPVLSVQPQQPSASNQQKLEMAKIAASRINISKNLGPEAQDITQQAAAAIFKGGMAAPQVSVYVTLDFFSEFFNLWHTLDVMLN